MSYRFSLNTHSSLHYLATVPNQYQHIYEPIAKQILFWIIKDLGMQGVWSSDWISFTSEHGTPLRQKDRNNNLRLQMHNRIDCSIRLNMDVDTVKWSVAHERLTQHLELGTVSPIVFHEKSSTLLSPWPLATNLTLNINLMVTSLSVAHQLMDAISLTLNPNNPGYVVNFAFDFPIPDTALGILLEVFKLSGIPENAFIRALQEYSNNQLSISMNTQTNKRQITCKQSYENAMIQIDMPVQEPNVVKVEQRTIGYSIPLEVTLQFHKPQAILVEYPIVVNNQHIPQILIDPEVSTWPPGWVSKYDKAYSPFLNLALYEQFLEGQVTRIPMVKAPYYDPWTPCSSTNFIQFGYKPFLSMVVLLDTGPDGKPTGTTTIDLANLGDISLVQSVLDELKISGGQALYYQDLYNVSIYANDMQVEPSSLTFDGQTLIMPHTDTNRVYRLILSVKEELLYARFISARVLVFDINTARGNR